MPILLSLNASYLVVPVLLAATLRGAAPSGLLADVERVPAEFVGVTDGCKGCWWPMLNDAVKTLEAIAVRVENAANDPATGGGPASAVRPAPPRQAEPVDPPTIPPEQVERLRQELPPPVVRGAGQKTHGRWIGPDGTVREIVSGNDPRTRLVNQQLAAKGWEDGTARDSDVEMELAADMAANGVRHATVVINNVPYKGRLGCETLVPVLLPEGSTLTVYGITPTGTRTRIRYTGGAAPWWR
ncbi:DddA-like double-stranded DNA deaminase toxin [Actinosynnema sp. NPDC050436]|uniref:DddA-like double-stranded DNA deaminase toxin n=1 Tax=Actinosynnema sp. NPDC050436 TaxID=3155659 RepID=UPI0033E01F83